ncbi:hypothetical protein AB0D30_01535 [Streptomyces sp. NPDC048409]|uniref:hypothetical protein n=1 Tax=Streptomyces sp. NPDC048409 TaxID=3154723 RepID=UPI0034497CE3
MTPRPRPTSGGVRLALVRLLLVLAAVLLPHGTAHAYDPGPVVAQDPEATPSDSASASDSAEPSRAGTLAGEGRMRPGRPQGPAAAVQGQDQDEDEPEEDEVAPGDGTGRPSPAVTSARPSGTSAPVPSTPRQQPAQQAAAPAEDESSEPVLHILPLGSGLVLIGLGLGLAFVALRVRRD